MKANWKLGIGAAVLVAVASACQPVGTATTAPTGAAPTTAPIATSTPVAASPPAVTQGPTTAPTASAATAGFATFEPKAGATTSVQGGATLFGAAGQTQVVIGVMSSSTDTMAASIQAGTCDSLTPEIAHRLTDVVSGVSSTTVAVDLSTLLATPYSINIFVMGSETESSITCGEIRPIVAP